MNNTTRIEDSMNTLEYDETLVKIEPQEDEIYDEYEEIKPDLLSLTDIKHFLDDQDDSMLSQEFGCTSPEIKEEPTTPDIIPKKSKKLYMVQYKWFAEWQKQRNTTSLSEDTILEYFEELSHKYKSSSLWSIYSMLKSTLATNHDVHINKYRRVLTLLKQHAENYLPKRSETFTADEIDRFIQEAPDDKYLATKVAMIMGTMGPCKINELYTMKVHQLEFFHDYIEVSVADSKKRIPRTFTITGIFYDIVKKYADLRAQVDCSDSFFMNFQNGKCIKHVIGINKLGGMGRQVAKFLNLPNPEKYTGGCFRRSSAGATKTKLKRNSDWKSTAVAESQVGDSEWKEMDSANQISSRIPSTSTTQVASINGTSSDSNTSTSDLQYNTDMSQEPSCTSPEIEETKSRDIIPQNSKKIYMVKYELFAEWQKQRNTTSFSEDTILEYFQELSLKYKSSSLWTTYSMLKSTLATNHNVHINKYPRVLALLRRQSENYLPKKTETFTGDEFVRFVEEAPDDKFLPIKVAMIMGIMGPCKINELYTMKVHQLEFFHDYVEVSVADSKNRIPRTFTITGTFYDIVKKYTDLRAQIDCSDSFFMNFQNGKCVRQVIGINKLGGMGKQVALFLKLPNPERYTGECFRRSSAILFGDGGATMAGLKRRGDRLSTMLAEGQMVDPKTRKINAANQFLSQIQSTSSTQVESIVGIPSANQILSRIPSMSTTQIGSIVGIPSANQILSQIPLTSTTQVKSIVGIPSANQILSRVPSMSTTQVGSIVGIPSANQILSRVPSGSTTQVGTIVGIPSANQILSQIPSMSTTQVGSIVGIPSANQILSQIPLTSTTQVGSIVGIPSAGNASNIVIPYKSNETSKATDMSKAPVIIFNNCSNVTVNFISK